MANATKTQTEIKALAVYFINRSWVSDRSFTSLAQAVDYCEANRTEARFEVDGTPVAVWNILGGFRSC